MARDGVYRLSTEEIMRVSRERFNIISSGRCIDLSTIQKSFDSTPLNLSDEEIKDVELAVLLIASAHKVSDKHFEDARRLLNLCDFLSSYKGNSVQRVVHYFTKALQERIAREMGITSSKGLESKGRKIFDPYQPTVGVSPALIACCLQLPCIQMGHFSGIQTVIDSLSSIRGGEHCPVLMQALANRQECPVELLKITALGISETKQQIEETGKCLTGFAEILKLAFSFSTAIVSHIKDLDEKIFGIRDDEVVAVFSAGVLRIMKSLPDCLQSIFRVLKNLNPYVMVIIEPEANDSSPIFTNRFHESLLYYSAWYDCIEACINRADQNRLSIEACLGEEIRDILAAKHKERIFEHMKIDEWRAYFASYGMVETEVSKSSFDEAELLLMNFACRKSCFLVRNGNCLVTGWKGTPLLSVSAWKFQQRQSKRSCTNKSKGQFVSQVC